MNHVKTANNLDATVATGMPSTDLLRLSLGIIYFHFGCLKFFPDLSPAEMLASQTVMRLSWHWLDAALAMRFLAVFECVIGLGFLFNIALRWISILFFVHMLGTFMPLVLLPEYAFRFFPFAPTMDGQYVLKNLVFVAAGWTVLLPHLKRRASQETQPPLPQTAIEGA